jgi:cytochrome c oxidase subunit 2
LGADKAGGLWNLVFGIAVAVFVIVEGLLVYAIVKFRHRPGREAAQFHGNTRLEVILTLIPALILAGIAVPTIKTIFELSGHPSNAMSVKVIGHQFWWEYQYPDQHITTANELHIPVGQPVYITDTSVDVIHSFWVPRLAGKQDAVPGHDNHLILEANKPGLYFGQCTEFCGLSHANMRIRVVAEPAAQFQQWVARQQVAAQTPRTGSLAAQGQKLFLGGACAGCHAIAGTKAAGIVGPNLTHFASRQTFAGSIFKNDDQELSAWLANPPGRKPGVDMPNLGLSSQQIKALIAYLDTLK